MELLLSQKHRFHPGFVNEKNKAGNNALLLAASFSEPISRLILDEPDFTGTNETNGDGVNAFLRASAMGRLDICRLLFTHSDFDRHGVNAIDRNGNNALLLAAGYGNIGICNFLLQGEASAVFEGTINSCNNR